MLDATMVVGSMIGSESSLRAVAAHLQTRAGRLRTPCDTVDWNAELVRGDLGKAVQQLKRESGKGLFVGGVKLPLALAELDLIDEYEFVVQPRLAGHGPTLFAGLSTYVDLKLVSRLEFGSGAVAMRYEPRR